MAGCGQLYCWPQWILFIYEWPMKKWIRFDVPPNSATVSVETLPAQWEAEGSLLCSSNIKSLQDSVSCLFSDISVCVSPWLVCVFVCALLFPGWSCLMFAPCFTEYSLKIFPAPMSKNVSVIVKVCVCVLAYFSHKAVQWRGVCVCVPFCSVLSAWPVLWICFCWLFSVIVDSCDGSELSHCYSYILPLQVSFVSLFVCVRFHSGHSHFFCSSLLVTLWKLELNVNHVPNFYNEALTYFSH